jgi:hypothetical protein
MKKLLIYKLTILSMPFVLGGFTLFPSDYRDSYVGNYLCYRSCQILSSNATRLEGRNDTITIHVTKNIEDSILNLRIAGNLITAKLVSNKLIAQGSNRSCGGSFSNSDSIKFSLSIGRAANFCSYLGKK